MIKNYIKVAFRNIKKFKGYSLINISGLAIGMASCILILLWVQDELSYDNFHEKGDNIYRLTSIMEENIWSLSPWALLQNLKENYPEIENGSWYSQRTMNTRYEEKIFNEEVALVSSDFFKLFTFQFLKGNPSSALNNINSVVISERIAIKLFGNKEPIGRVINLGDNEGFIITGVIENIPAKSHMQFDIVARPDIFYGKDRLESWILDCSTYILLSKGVNYNDVARKILNVINKNDNGEWDGKMYVGLQPLKEIHLYALSGADPITNVYLFSTIAIILLIIACINFTNLSIARSATRSQEIGIRKVIGADKKDVITQFFAESFILVFISMFIAVVIVSLFLPTFNTLSEKQLTVNFIRDINVVFELIALAFVTGVLGGAYPSLYLSSFEPIKILKSNNSIKASKSNLLRRGLIIFQFSAAIILIISVTIILKQMQYIKSKDLGFSRDNIITLKMDKNLLQKYDIVKQELLKNKDILNITAASCIPLNTDFNSGVYWEGMKPGQSELMNFVCVDYDYFETFSMRMVLGRSFSKKYQTDVQNYIINEAALKMTGYKEPIGKLIGLGKNEPGHIVGVINDFNGTSLHNPIQPTIFMLYNYTRKNNLFVKVSNENTTSTLGYIKKIISIQSPGSLVETRFLDEDFNNMYSKETKLQSLLVYFTILALFISCIGLLGLVAFMAERRTKDIAIRKVLGATVIGLVHLLSKEFLALVLIANLIAWPIGYYLMEEWINEFTYRTDIGILAFILSGLIAFTIALLTVGFQAIKTASANPIKSLKCE